MASSAARPEASTDSPTARAVVTATQPVWTMASSRVSSKSSPWASVPLARAAAAAATRALLPITTLSGAPPSRPATSVTARPNACREDARQLPRVSSARSVACAETAGVTASSEEPDTNRAKRRATERDEAGDCGTAVGLFY